MHNNNNATENWYLHDEKPNGTTFPGVVVFSKVSFKPNLLTTRKKIIGVNITILLLAYNETCLSRTLNKMKNPVKPNITWSSNVENLC